MDNKGNNKKNGKGGGPKKNMVGIVSIIVWAIVIVVVINQIASAAAMSGQVEIKKDLSDSIEGVHVIVVEDILDSGNTLSYLLHVLEARHPASIKLCTLLDKPERRVKPINADYVGFTVPNAFIVGYGLDYSEKYRNLPYIGILKPEIYSD